MRDLVFMKGCSLRCLWCSNPESENPFPEVAFIAGMCIGCVECGWCLEVCPAAAIKATGDNKIQIDRELCTNCGECAKVCPSKAIKLFGEHMSVEDVLRVLEEDSMFYSRSGGGITVGGGEPLLQADFVGELLKRCRERGIDTAIETCGYASWEAMKKVCRHANSIFYDIKEMDPNKHKSFTGVTNKLILENAKKLSRFFPETPIMARTPIVPGFNDSEENIKAIADFLSRLDSVREYELLPYHRFGEPKYQQLGREYQLIGLQPPGEETMAKLRTITQQLVKALK